jgi:type I restriction enzyme S subunit
MKFNSVPTGWSVRPLWSMFAREKNVGHPAETMLSVFREHGVVEKDSRTNLNVTADNRNIYQLVDRGWLVVNRMKAWQGSVGISPLRGIVSGHYLCFRPVHAESPRYLNWLLRSAPYIAAYSGLSRGVRPGQAEIDNDQLRVLEVLLPSLREQRRIADFLDEQVALLDQAIELRQAQSSLLGDRLQALIDEVGDGSFSRWGLRDQSGLVKAGRILRVLPGYAFPSDEFSVDMGTPLLRGINVGVRQINWGDVLSWEPGDQRVLRAFSLRLGDVVMGMDRPWINGGLRIARLGKEDLPSLLLQRVACLRPGPELDAEYMYWAYQARRFREEVEGMLTGLSVPHLSGDQISSYQVFLPSTAVQLRVASDLTLAGNDTARAVSLTGRQIGLLQERKRSLITAAVTGQFDVTTARRVA